MNLTIKKLVYALIALTLAFTISCGGNSSSENEEKHSESDHPEGMEHGESEGHDMEEMEHEHTHGEESGTEETSHKHSDEMGSKMMGEAFTWMAMEKSMDMVEYKTENVMLMKHGEDNVLMLSPNGKKASCMFKNKQGNVGVTATIKLDGTEGVIKLVHHSTGKDNYEFVALDGNRMKLGRVENGEKKILDSKEVEIPQDWFTLTVTAAGSHFKGYINDKMITHGHADEMAAGYVGLIASGKNSISVKKVEATPLEAEH